MSDAAPTQEPLRGGALALTAFALAIGTFMQVLDTTIANVSLPTIAGSLGESSDSSTWVITSFAVANGIAVPLTGWLMGRFGVIRTFFWSVTLFTVASFLCGIAWSLPSLILFRIIQGAVSGPMIPGSQALLIAIFPAHKRATALGIWAMTMMIAPIMGPILGGVISDNYHWSWIFLINVPFGLFCALTCRVALAGRETPTRKLPIDKVGMAMLVLWVGSLQIMLDLGKNDDWFNSTRIVALAVIAIIGFLAWLIWETTEAQPAVDLSLFRQRNFMLGTVASSIGYGVFFANVVILPLWLQTQMGYTATWAGLVQAPTGIVALAMTPIVTRLLLPRVDARALATFSFAAFVASYFMRSGFTTTADFWTIALPMAVQGMAMSCFFVSLLTIQLDGMPPQKVPSATGISNFARITAGSFGASIVTTAWDRREALHQSRLAETVNPTSPAYSHAVEVLHGLGTGDLQANAVIARQMVGQAYLLAANDLFYISALLMAVMILPIWLARRPAPQQGATVVAD